MALNDIATRLKFLDWYITKSKYDTIPSGRWDNAIKDNVVALDTRCKWVVNRKSENVYVYLQEAVEAYTLLHMLLRLNDVEIEAYILCAGYEGDLYYWTKDITFHVVLDDSKLSHDKYMFIQKLLADTIFELNQYLNNIKNSNVPKLKLCVYNGRSNPIDAPTTQKLTPLVNDISWFSYRHNLTGLLLDAKLGRVYKHQWTKTAVDIFLTSSDRHLIELKWLCESNLIDTAILERTKKGLSKYMRVAHEMSINNDQWLIFIKTFLNHKKHNVHQIKLPANIFD